MSSTWITKNLVKKEKELSLFDKAIVQLIEIGSNLKDPTPLLIMCLSNFEEKDTEVKINGEIYIIAETNSVSDNLLFLAFCNSTVPSF